MGTNDAILILVALFFGYLALAIHYEEKRATDRRKRDLGPPDGIERRSRQDRRRNSLLNDLRWALRSQLRRLARRPGPKGGTGT